MTHCTNKSDEESTRRQQSTGAAAKTAIVEKPASKDGVFSTEDRSTANAMALRRTIVEKKQHATENGERSTELPTKCSP
jgi:hypothetical protein